MIVMPAYRPGMNRRRLLITSLAGLTAPLPAEAQPSKGRISRSTDRGDRPRGRPGAGSAAVTMRACS
jgi:hypothetical protein